MVMPYLTIYLDFLVKLLAFGKWFLSAVITVINILINRTITYGQISQPNNVVLNIKRKHMKVK